MACFPSFETLLLSVHSALGLQYDQKKKSILQRKGVFHEHVDKVTRLIDDVFQELDVSDQDAYYLIENIISTGSYYDAVRRNAFTYNLSDGQVAYYVASCLVMPQIGRHLAFWQWDTPIDKGMPGGHFWFLPSFDPTISKQQLVMPTRRVVDWLLDLLGESVDGAGRQITELDSDKEDEQSIVRTLRNWRKGTTPIRAKIEEYFPDRADSDSGLTFYGVLDLDVTISLNDQLDQVKTFIRQKNLNASELAIEIPMAEKEIDALVGQSLESLDADRVERFIDLLRTRYAKPSMQTIRNRLKVARACEQGYRNLVKLISGSGSTYKAVDLSTNKTMQLIEILKLSYNLTNEALEKRTYPFQDDLIFAKSVPPYMADNIFGFIYGGDSMDTVPIVTEHLNTTFRSLIGRNEVFDLMPTNEDAIEQFIKDQSQKRKAEIEIVKQVGQVRTACPNKIKGKDLKNITSFDVLYRLLSFQDRYQNKEVIIQRMKDVKSSRLNKLEALCVELALILNNEGYRYFKPHTKHRVEQLLDQFEKHPDRSVFEPYFYGFSAKHYLKQNRFDEAKSKFKKALKVTENCTFGELTGEIARDLLALELVLPQNKYHLSNLNPTFNIMHTNLTPESSPPEPTIEEAVEPLIKYFWEDFYKPYPDVQKEEQVPANLKVVLDTVLRADRQLTKQELEKWVDAHRDLLKAKSVSAGRNETLLMLLIKYLASPCRAIVERNTRLAIEVLIEQIPVLASKCDFKGQTPFMLAANNGDVSLLSKLLGTNAELKRQDFKGRTAIHAAVASRSMKCLVLLAQHKQFSSVIRLVATNQANVMHTAVRAGNYAAVELLIKQYPDPVLTRKDQEEPLIKQQDDSGYTPFELAVEIARTPECFDEYRSHMERESRPISEYAEFQKISALLSEYA